MFTSPNGNGTNGSIGSPGASRDRNWYQVSVDQTTGLPDVDPVVLPKLSPRLEDAEDFDDWYDEVVHILTDHNLHLLIDANLPRPSRSDPARQQWHELSCQVARWLEMSVSNEFYLEIRAHGNDVALKPAMMRFLNIRRVDFDNTSDFIATLEDNFSVANARGAMFTPYLALCIMLQELSTVLALEAFIDLKEKELYAISDPQLNITEARFHETCSTIINHVKRAGIDSLS
ncbi:unnamed protein product [Penicillium discolor]